MGQIGDTPTLFSYPRPDSTRNQSERWRNKITSLGFSEHSHEGSLEQMGKTQCTSRPGERNGSWKLHWIGCRVEDKPGSRDWDDKPVSREILASLNKYNWVPIMCFTEALQCQQRKKTQLETVSQKLHANLGRNNPSCGVSCSMNSLVTKNVGEGGRRWRQIGQYFSDKGYLKRKLKELEFENQTFLSIYSYLFFLPFYKEASG